MSAFTLWSYRRSPFYDVVLKPKPETFKDFLSSLWIDVIRDTTDTQLLINAACELFDLKDVKSLIEYVDNRLSEPLQKLFFEVTESFYFEPSRLTFIRELLSREIHNPSDEGNGVNQCFAMWLMGAFEAAFSESYDYHYLYAFYTVGATLPLYNGEIPKFSETQIKSETEYKDRVIFSVLINDLQIMVKKAIKELGIFKFGDISELGNILRKDASLVGFGNSFIYNSMRLI